MKNAKADAGIVEQQIAQLLHRKEIDKTLKSFDKVAHKIMPLA